MAAEVGCDDGVDVLEDAALEQALAVGVTLDGVPVVVLPDAVDGVEECGARERGTAAGGVVNVVI